MRNPAERNDRQAMLHDFRRKVRKRRSAEDRQPTRELPVCRQKRSFVVAIVNDAIALGADAVYGVTDQPWGDPRELFTQLGKVGRD